MLGIISPPASKITVEYISSTHHVSGANPPPIQAEVLAQC